VQLTIDRSSISAISGTDRGTDEHAARRALRAQVAKLERELAEIVAESFPYVAVPPREATARGVTCGPRLLDLGQLERTRDELAGRIQRARQAVTSRAEHHARAHELLERMKRDPKRHKFVRLPVRDLGEGGCGVWEVRPKLGPIGMLAGWWQVKLSSGCPLARGRATAWPGYPPVRRVASHGASPRASVADGR
jgi:hypothetical protein